MKVYELLSLMGKMRDVNAILSFFIASNKAAEGDQTINQQNIVVLKQYLAKLQMFLNEKVQDNLNESILTTEIDVGPMTQQIIQFCNLLLNESKNHDLLKVHLNNVTKFRDIYFEILSSEHNFIAKCNAIDVASIIQIVNEYYETENVVKHRAFREVQHLLEFYPSLQNHLEMTIEIGIKCANNPYMAVSYLLEKLQSLDFDSDYRTFEELSIHYDKLQSLIAEVKDDISDSNQKKRLSDALQVLSEPLQRTMRYPMLLNRALEGGKLEQLFAFYQQHNAPQLDLLKVAMAELTDVFNTMKSKAQAVDEKVGIFKQEETRKALLKRRQSLTIQSEKLESKSSDRTRSRSFLGFLGSNSTFDSAILTAAKEDRIRLAKKALRDGANINARDTGFHLNYTPLIHASKEGHTEFVRYLTELNFEVYPLDTKAQTHLGNKRNTALHWAARMGHTEIVEILVTIDPIPATITEDEFGFTPLHFAAENNHLDACKALFKECGNVLLVQTDSRGRTPLQVATDNNANDVIEYLTLLNQDLKNTDDKKIEKSVTR